MKKLTRFSGLVFIGNCCFGMYAMYQIPTMVTNKYKKRELERKNFFDNYIGEKNILCELSPAAEKGEFEVVKHILTGVKEKKIVLDIIVLAQALEYAAEYGHSNVVHYMLWYIDDNNLIMPRIFFAETLECAARKGRIEVVDELLAYVEQKKIIVEEEYLRNALKEAAKKNYSATIRSLMLYIIRKKISLNTLYIEYILLFIVRHGHHDLVELVLKYIKKERYIMSTLFLPVMIKEAAIRDYNAIIFSLLAKKGEKLTVNAIQESLKQDISSATQEDIRGYLKVKPVLTQPLCLADYMQKNSSINDLGLLFSWLIMSDEVRLVKNFLKNREGRKIFIDFPLLMWLKIALAWNAKRVVLMLLPFALASWKKEALEQEKEERQFSNNQFAELKEYARKIGKKGLFKLLYSWQYGMSIINNHAKNTLPYCKIAVLPEEIVEKIFEYGFFMQLPKKK